MTKKEGALRRFVANRYRSYTPDGKFWLTVGVLVLIVDMAIAYCAGATVTMWHGLGFAGCALAFAFMPDAAYEEYDQGRYISCAALGVLCIPIGIQTYQQQLTYSAGLRTGDMQQTKAQNVKYTGAQDGLADTRTNVALWTKMLTDLQAQAPWAATVKAEALREEVATLRGRLAAETKGQRGRKAGCGAECERLENAITEATNKIGTAERADDLSKKIEAAKAVLATAREKADKTEYKSSVIANVANINAQLVKLITGSSAAEAVQIDEVAMNYANVASAGLGSLALLLLAPVAFFLAGRRRHPCGEPELPIAANDASPFATPFVQPSTSLAKLGTNTIVRTDRSVWKDLAAALRAA